METSDLKISNGRSVSWYSLEEPATLQFVIESLLVEFFAFSDTVQLLLSITLQSGRNFFLHTVTIDKLD